MSALIPQTFIDDILSRIDITEVIGTRIKLRRQGNNLSATCPFHNEKTPSFTVSQTKQFYHCFGCGAHGNVITFLMQFDRLDFISAVELLSGQLGIPMPVADASTPQHQPTTELTNLLAKIAKYYQKQLHSSQTAINYLKSRGLSGEICKTFNIGYAPKSWDNLAEHYQNTTNIQSLITAGLLIEKNQKKFARFHDRIMFPIRNTRGLVIGFGGRSIGSDLPKYLNSPETPVFHKGNELYGLYESKQARNNNTDPLLVVEGYMDVVTLAQYDINNVVATSGTAVTTKQTQQLLRNSNNIVFCFDGDQAGRTAAWRAFQNILPLMRDDIQIRFLFIPDGHDPDSLVRQEGKAQFMQRLNTAIPIANYFFDSLTAKININTLDGKARFAQAATDILKTMPNGFFKQLLLQELTKIVPINIDDLQQESIAALTGNNQQSNQITNSRSPLVHNAIRLLLHQPQLASTVRNDDVTIIETLPLPNIKLLIELLSLLKNHPNFTIGAIIEYWRDKPEELCILTALASQDLPFAVAALQKEFQGSIIKLRYHGKKRAIQNLLDKATVETLTNNEKLKLHQLIVTLKGQESDLSFNNFADTDHAEKS